MNRKHSTREKVTGMLIAVVWTAFCWPLSAFAEQEVYKLGVIAPLSGNVAPWGNDVKKALLFARNELKASQFEIIFEDDRCHGKKAATAAQKLVHVDKVDFAMVICTESMLATAPIFERAKTLVITPVATGAAISKSGDYIFRTWPSDLFAAQLLYEYTAKRHKIFGVITEERGYPRELENAFQLALKDGTMHLHSVAFMSDEPDVRSILLRLKKLNVEGLLINTNSEYTYLNVLKQVGDLGWDVPLYGVYVPGYDSFSSLAGELVNNIIFVDAPSADSSLTSEGKKLYRKFVAQYGPPAISTFVFPSTFEAFRLFVEGARSSDDLKHALYKDTFSGIFGPYQFDSNGDIQGIRHELKLIANGNLWRIEH